MYLLHVKIYELKLIMFFIKERKFLLKDKVSIIVPVFNTQDFLKECIESLINQDYKNIEIILVDDASSDNSPEICKKYTEKDSRIKFIRHTENCGQEKSRNDGIASASGEWIMFCDSDDLFSIYAVKTMLEFVTKNNLNFAFSSFYYWKNCQNDNEYREIDAIKNNEGEMISGEKIFKTEQIAKQIFNEIPFSVISCIGSKIYSKKFLDEKKINFNMSLNWGEDMSFMIHCLMQTDKVGYINFPFYLYRIRQSGSVLSSYRKDIFKSASKTYYLIKNFMDKYNAFDLNAKNFYWDITNHAILSAVSELKYNSFDAFRKELLVIKTSRYFNDVTKNLNLLDFKKKFFIFLVKNNFARLLSFILKIRDLKNWGRLK